MFSRREVCVVEYNNLSSLLIKKMPQSKHFVYLIMYTTKDIPVILHHRIRVCDIIIFMVVKSIRNTDHVQQHFDKPKREWKLKIVFHAKM